MSKIDDGGQAFPCAAEHLLTQKGMTLRDWFAANALPMAHEQARHMSVADLRRITNGHAVDDDIVGYGAAVLAYRQAAAMVAVKLAAEKRGAA